MRLLLIKGGVVENAVVVDDATAALMRSVYVELYDAVLIGSDEPGSPGPGWSVDGSTFTAPLITESAPSTDVIAELRAQVAAISARLDAQQVAIVEVENQQAAADTPTTTDPAKP